MRAKLFVLGLLVSACSDDMATPIDAAVPCPETFTRVIGAGDLAYGPVEPGLTWVGAYMQCFRNGTRLATPMTEFEALALDNHANVTDQWVGVSRIDTGEEWTTVYGQPAMFLPWDATNSEPNGTGECVFMNSSSEYFDNPCQDVNVFVCECRGP